MSDSDELSTNLGNLSLDHDSDWEIEVTHNRERELINRRENTMALDLGKLSQLSALIPRFNGDENQLGSFLRAVDSLVKNCGIATPTLGQWEIILCTIYQKLDGPAQDLVNSRPELLTWPPIKSLLTENFADHKTLSIWQQEITMLQMKNNESIPDFCNRTMAMRAKIVQKIQFTFESEEVRVAQMETFSMFLLNKFKTCLPYNFNMTIEAQHATLTTLDLTIQEVLRLNSAQMFANQFRNRNTLPPKPLPKIPQNIQYRQNYNTPQRNPNAYTPQYRQSSPNFIPRNPYVAVPQNYPSQERKQEQPPVNRAQKPPQKTHPPNIFPRYDNRQESNDPNRMSTTTHLSNRTHYQNYNNSRPRTQPGYLNYFEPVNENPNLVATTDSYTNHSVDWPPYDYVPANCEENNYEDYEYYTDNIPAAYNTEYEPKRDFPITASENTSSN